ncbi:MAG: cell wall-binding repeat-containing protein [Ruminococcus sp.]|nr:cell wall-binding repeat-containing protein [Ruminococcus sp.]
MSIIKKLTGAVCALALCVQTASAVFAQQAQTGMHTDSGVAVASLDAQVDVDAKYLEGVDVNDDPSYIKFMKNQQKVGVTDFTSLVTHQAKFNSFNKIYGIDVSVYNGDIDFEKVKAEGYSFVIVRAGARGYGSAGKMIEDSRFEEHVDNAHKAGLMVGAYYYTQAVNKAEVKQEADVTLRKIGSRKLEMPVYFDIEPAYDWNGAPGRLVAANLSKAQKADLCKYFCDLINNAGYQSGVTSCKSWFEWEIDMSSLEKQYDVWLAHYTNSTNYASDYNMWQFNSTRKVNGVYSNYTDQDVRYIEMTKPSGALKITASASGTNVVLKWDAIANTKGYTVYKKDVNGTINKISTVTGTTLTVTREQTDTYYYVQGYNYTGGSYYYSDLSNGAKVAGLSVTNADVTKLAGSNRYATAALVSKQCFPSISNTVILAAGDSYADSLVSAPLANAFNAPVLLTYKDMLPDATVKEMSRLGAAKAYLIGGEGVISKKVEDQLKAKGITPLRIHSSYVPDRYGTAVYVSANMDIARGKAPTDVFIAYANGYADTLAVSSIAAMKNAPILYINGSGLLDGSTKYYLDSIKGTLKNIYIIGGTGVISSKAESTLAPYGTVKRLSGSNRYETCVAVNNYFSSILSGKSVCLTTGQNYPDALSGGVLAAKNKAPMMIVDSVLSANQKSYLNAKAPSLFYTLGGNSINMNLVQLAVNGK